jgi:uncharacterized secreted protein with C-terminal beta-propeller domain
MKPNTATSRRAGRTGAAVLAAGLALAGPAAVGPAAAEDSGAGAETAGGPVAEAVSGGVPAERARPARADADSRGGRSAPTAGAAEDGGPSPRHSPDEPDPEGPDPTEPVPTDPTDPATATALRPATRPAGGPATREAAALMHTPVADSGPGQPAAASTGATVTITTSTAGATEPTAAAATLPAAIPPIAAVPAAPGGIVAAAVGRFLDSTSRWIDTLPGGPVVEFLQGAMLLVRRALAGFLAPPGSATSAGQTAANAPYLTEQQLRDYLLELAARQFGSLYGQTVAQYDYGYKWVDGALVPMTAAGDGRDGITSDTNTQVDGVDEADLVETDGRYVYIAGRSGLTILDADATVVSHGALPGFVIGQFLSGDRLTVITQSGYGGYPMAQRRGLPWRDWNPQTTVTVYDVTDRAAPVVAAQTVFDGAYRDARAVDGTVYVVLDRGVRPPEPLYTEVPAALGAEPSLHASNRWAGPSVVSYRTYETWDAYLARVGDQITTLSLPHAYAVDPEGNLVDLGVITGAGQIVRPGGEAHSALLTAVSIDSATTSGGFDSAVASLTTPGATTVYMTPAALYLATSVDRYTDTGATTDTRIDRFGVDGTAVGWQASGTVAGTLINQFAMDEHDGYLRVATHTWSSQWAGGTWATVRDSGVYVLDTEGETMDLVGSLTGLAPGEHLYAVRFAGGKGYLVTFLQTDPLFAVDLADPRAPSLDGELVIPGFSNYLHPVGPGLLMGIGQEQQPGSWNSRLHVSLFDVGGGAPIEIERQFLDETAQWSWSQAQFDHHALLYTAADGLLVVPVAASGYDPQTGAYRYDQTLRVLRVTPTGIEVLGSLAGDGDVLRTVRIGDVLFAVSHDHVTAYDLTDLSLITRTPLAAPRTAVGPSAR